MRGLEELKRRVAEVKRRYVAAAKGAVYLRAHEVMDVAKRRTPLDFGPLRASAYVTLPEVEGDTVVAVEMGYGGPAAEYAVRQHEDLALNHPEPGTGAKFLSSAVDEAKPDNDARLAHLFRKFLESGATGDPARLGPTGPDQGRAVAGSVRAAKLRASAARKRKATRKAARKARG